MCSLISPRDVQMNTPPTTPAKSLCSLDLRKKASIRESMETVASTTKKNREKCLYRSLQLV